MLQGIVDSSTEQINDVAGREAASTRTAIQQAGHSIEDVIKSEGPYLGPFTYDLGVQEITGAVATAEAATVAAIGALGIDVDTVVGASTTAIVAASTAQTAALITFFSTELAAIYGQLQQTAQLSRLIADNTQVLPILTGITYKASVQLSGTGFLFGDKVKFTPVYNATANVPVLPGQRYKVALAGGAVYTINVSLGIDPLASGGLAIVDGETDNPAFKLSILVYVDGTERSQPANELMLTEPTSDED